MRSPGTARAASLKHAPQTIAGKPRLRQRRLADDPSVAELLAQPVGSLGDEVISLDFRHAPFSTVPPHSSQVFGELVIVTGDAAVRIGSPDDDDSGRCVLTGTRGRHNDCLLLFRHAYGTVICQLGVGNVAADAHIGFLQHGDFAEVRTFSFTKPRERLQGSAGFWTTLEYSARHLNELQGIVWRGGTVCIERIRLEP
ncbi:hypothetical protein KPL74_19680 [Bacillus sp. NP157]|nr:hypothetical protein KPL74_19680 [Bacillus sp. NP157]